MSGRSVNLTTLFLGRLRPPKRLTSTSCTFSRQYLTTALLEKAEGDTKVCCQTGYRTQDPWLTSQVPYRLRYAARLKGEKHTYQLLNIHERRAQARTVITKSTALSQTYGYSDTIIENSSNIYFFYHNRKHMYY